MIETKLIQGNDTTFGWRAGAGDPEDIFFFFFPQGTVAIACSLAPGNQRQLNFRTPLQGILAGRTRDRDRSLKKPG